MSPPDYILLLRIASSLPTTPGHNMAKREKERVRHSSQFQPSIDRDRSTVAYLGTTHSQHPKPILTCPPPLRPDF